MMRLTGKRARSPYGVVPNDRCKGLGLGVCPMGIEVASYAHKDKRPIQAAFGLDTNLCIGCGRCIDICPVGAPGFAPVGRSGLIVVSRPATAEAHTKESNP